MSARFVLLRHECSPEYSKPSHWDFMLEHEGVLLTWQLDDLPALWAEPFEIESRVAGDSVEAIRLADHRLHYLDYEGPISGDRGSVARLDRGTLTWIEQSPDRLAIRLHGTRLVGTVTLKQQGDSWLLFVENGLN